MNISLNLVFVQREIDFKIVLLLLLLLLLLLYQA
jgi:hypothetical protein